MICHICGVEAPTKYVAYYQNIGMLFMRMSRSIDGHMCKSCVHKYFWQFTLINLTLGWWGMISLIVNPFFILNNFGRYLMCLGMDSVPPGATAPDLTDDEAERLHPHAQELFERLNGDEQFDRVAESIAMKAAVSAGQVALYVQLLIGSMENEEDE